MPDLILLAVLLPLAGAIYLALRPKCDVGHARATALVVSSVTLVLAVRLVTLADPPTYDVPWLVGDALSVRFTLALDGLGWWMFGLSALLSFVGVLVSWDEIQDRARGFYALLLVLETGMLGVFVAQDLLLFYIFFEFTLIPLFFLIGIWGHEQRRWAAAKFFLYTLAGSLMTFLGLLAIVIFCQQQTGVLDFSIPALTEQLAKTPLPTHLQYVVFLALFLGFAIKVPMVPVHTWLPLAHVQAPTAGSVLLAGVLLKLGTYGLVRFSMPMLPEATVSCAPWILVLSVIGILYGALVALAQADMKRMIAYSSVSHMGFCVLGLFALNPLGLQGGVLQMINHGIATGGLFAIVGMIYARYHTREIARLGGLARRLPRLAVMLLIFTFASIGLPGTNGFVGEFLILLGMFQRGWADAPLAHLILFRVLAVAAVGGVVLGAWYMLWLVQRVMFGPLKEPDTGHGHAADEAPGHAADAHGDHGHGDHGHGPAPLPPSDVRDLNAREMLALAPLAALVFWIGLFPQRFLDRMDPELTQVARVVGAAAEQQWQTVEVAGEENSPQQSPAKTEPKAAVLEPESQRVKGIARVE